MKLHDKKYPRYFITLDHGELGYDFIYKFGQPGDNAVRFDILDSMILVGDFFNIADFNENECEERVLSGRWREVPHSEIALIL